MLNWVLVIALLSLTVISYKLDNRCFLSPSFVICFSMMLSSLIVAINTHYWEYVISIQTVFIILGAVFSFSLGQYVIQLNKKHLVLKTHTNRNDSPENVITLYVPRRIAYYIALFFVIFTALLFYRHQRSVAQGVGMMGSLSTIVQANRYYSDASTPGSIKILLLLSKVITYYLTTVYLGNRILQGVRQRGFLTLLIGMAYLSCCALTTNRIDLVNAASALIFIVFYFSYYKKDWYSIKKTNKKLIIRVVIISVLGIALFRLFGELTGKTGMFTLYDNVCLYIGSPLVCLDRYVTGKSAFGNFHVQLLNHLFSTLNSFGFKIEIDTSVYPFQYWTHGASNIYSSVFPYLVKFGSFGLLFVELLEGMIYGQVWYKIKNNKSNWILAIIYGNFFFVLTMFSIAERFFDQLFTVTTFLEIIILYFLLKYSNRTRI